MTNPLETFIQFLQEAMEEGELLSKEVTNTRAVFHLLLDGKEYLLILQPTDLPHKEQ